MLSVREDYWEASGGYHRIMVAQGGRVSQRRRLSVAGAKKRPKKMKTPLGLPRRYPAKKKFIRTQEAKRMEQVG